MKSHQPEPERVRIGVAYNPTEALRLRILLDGGNIPYWTQNDFVAGLYPLNTAVGPMEFWSTPAGAHRLQEVFAVSPEARPDHCPACHEPTEAGRLDCPACGLFLG